MSSFTFVQHCPCPVELAPVLERIASRAGIVYLSIYRGADVEAMLRSVGKKSQAKLWRCYQERLRVGFCPPSCAGDCNPANPPGFSTHELRNDGVAYPGRRGGRLAPWKCGVDVRDDQVEEFVAEAAREGLAATITYPRSRAEHHHVNFRRPPVLGLPALRLGSRGPRVALLTRRLKRLGYLPRAYWNFEPDVAQAVRSFQRDHRQRVDGVVGPQTQRQLEVAVRRLGALSVSDPLPT